MNIIVDWENRRSVLIVDNLSVLNNLSAVQYVTGNELKVMRRIILELTKKCVVKLECKEVGSRRNLWVFSHDFSIIYK